MVRVAAIAAPINTNIHEETMTHDRPALARYVQNVGQCELARQLGLTQGATQAWASGRSRPNPDRAAELVVLSRGELTFEQIYAPEMLAGKGKCKPKAKKPAKKKSK
jgi:transcriptional regulator with XRE-family HTH domain